MDLLKVLVVVQRCRGLAATIGMPIDLDDINDRLIYSASTVDKMTEVILGLVRRQE